MKNILFFITFIVLLLLIACQDEPELGKPVQLFGSDDPGEAGLTGIARQFDIIIEEGSMSPQKIYADKDAYLILNMTLISDRKMPVLIPDYNITKELSPDENVLVPLKAYKSGTFSVIFNGNDIGIIEVR